MNQLTSTATSTSSTRSPLVHSPNHTFQGGLSWYLEAQAKSQPDKTAVFWNDETITYGDLYLRALAIKRRLKDAGITHGDRIGLLFPNHPDFVAAFFAASSLGATVVPINPLLKFEEIAHILSDSQSKALVVHESHVTEVLSALPLVAGLEHLFVFTYETASPPNVPVAVHLLTPSLRESTLSASTETLLSPFVNPEQDLAVLVYTSGTTGKPKGAMLTHNNLFASVKSAGAALPFYGSDRLLAVLPLCHIYGLSVVMLGVFSQGASLVILKSFEAKPVLDTIESKKVTVFPAVPTMYQFLLMEQEKRKADLSSLRICLCGGAPMPVELIEQFQKDIGTEVIEGYGLTEVSCAATMNPQDGVKKIGSVGLPIEDVAIGIFNDDGQMLPVGEIGEVAIAGPNVMMGYYRKKEASEEVLKGEWFLTGDLGYLDSDGYLYIAGRKKELIIRGGQNIYPREIEKVLLRMASVADAAVLGVPDKYMGERVKAVVVRKPGAALSEDEVKTYCLEHLAEYKVPRLVEFKEALPKNSTGKVLKRLLV